MAGIKIKYRRGETYFGDAERTTFPVPDGIDIIERISVDGVNMKPGTDYKVNPPRLSLPAESFTLAKPPAPGANVTIVGVELKRRGQ